MNQSTNLTLYFVLVFGIIVLPGIDMAFVMGSAVLGGRRSGLAAVAGIVAGGFCHLLMGALGVAAVLRWWPPLFDVMLAGGAIYLAWIGISLLRSSGMALPSLRGGVAAPSVTFRRAILTSLVNPKAYLFMLAVFPQFLQPGAGPIWMQAGVLGAITSVLQVAVYGALALLASRASIWLDGKPGASAIAARAIGLLLLAVAAMTAAQFGRVLP